MFCRKCGYKVLDKGRFCPKCGACLEQNSVANESPKGIGRKKIVSIIATVFICLLAVCAIGMGMRLYQQAKYDKLVSRAALHTENCEIDAAIDCLTKAIELKPDCSDNYISLATAYVKKWDLYNASEILQQGYNITQDAGLKHVLIWGPLSPVEVALYSGEGVPITQCQYVFSENTINSYVYGYGGGAGAPYCGSEYICEDGKVKYVSLIQYQYSGLAGIYPDQVPNYPGGLVTGYFDLEYDSEGYISSVTYDDKVLALFEYSNGNCVAITELVNFIDAYDSVTLIYDECNRISQLCFAVLEANESITHDFTYHSDGSSSVSITANYSGEVYQYENICLYDENGMLISLNEPDGIDSFLTTKNGAYIESIEGDSICYEFKYSEGKLSEITETDKETGETYTIKYTYQDVCGVDFLSEAQYGDSTVSSIRYDEQGNICSITNSNSVVKYTYSEDGMLTSYGIYDIGSDVPFCTYVVEYDSVGRMIGRNGVG